MKRRATLFALTVVAAVGLVVGVATAQGPQAQTDRSIASVEHRSMLEADRSAHWDIGRPTAVPEQAEFIGAYHLESPSGVADMDRARMDWALDADGYEVTLSLEQAPHKLLLDTSAGEVEEARVTDATGEAVVQRISRPDGSKTLSFNWPRDGVYYIASLSHSQQEPGQTTELPDPSEELLRDFVEGIDYRD